MNWTKEQMQVITLRDKNLLVSAAAGSGKTAVLTERVIGRILDEACPVDIDRMLIVTFTSAAAAEMRERIGGTIESALEKDPQNSHLMKQSVLARHAQITTIHSFCLNLIRNYFHRVDLEPNFRMAEEGELNLLKEDVMAEVLNRNYEAGSKAFLKFVECFATGKSDDALGEMVLKLYDFAMSYPWPKEWLAETKEAYRFADFADLEKKKWMRALEEYLKKICGSLRQEAMDNVALSSEEDGPLYLKEVLERDALRLTHLSGAADYKEMAGQLAAFSFDRLPSKRGYEGSPQKLELAKQRREEIKETVKKIKADFFFAGEDEMMGRLSEMGPVAEELTRLAGEFMDSYDAKKREKNILDFDDLEHFALKILIDEETKEPTEIAAQCRKLYEEVMIDEYQDSNLVQETLLRAVSREDAGAHNRFMVGDVKQSIYRFRLARPELFMEKYDTYPLAGEEGADGCLKIELRKNFRSREEVLDFTNHIFFRLMKKDLGNVEYDEAAALYAGAGYPESPDMKAEFLLADSRDELLEDAQLTDPVRLEAHLAASRIRQMMRGQKVTDKKTGELRDARYSDIVILLRSFGRYADTFLEVFEQKNIPAHASSKTGYFKTTEIQTILSFLRVLDNPRQDIPLAAVLRSPLFGFTDEELASLKAAGGKQAFHLCVLKVREETMPKELFLKTRDFLRELSRYRDLVEELPVHELLARILDDTGYLRYAAAMPGGERRKANILMLLEKASAYEKTSYRGLFHFIRYMDKLQKYEVDYGEADIVSENENAVRFMTIHKSKGLEFPIVFLCGTAKQFNRMDTKSGMVIHPDLGIALDYINPNSRARGATLYKKAVAKQMDLENMGEELRVLYVALTRAKEKLVVTGVTADAGEKVRRFSERFGHDGSLPFLLRAGANSFLDWLLPAVASGEDKDLIRICGVADLVQEEAESQLGKAEGLSELLRGISAMDEEADRYVSGRLSYRYPDLAETTRKTKYSVSELKSRSMESMFEEQEILEEGMARQEEIVPYVPRFAGGEHKEHEGALRGVAMHKAIECLPVELLSGNQDLPRVLNEQIRRLVETGRLTEEMERLLRRDKLLRFYRSKLAERMKLAALRQELRVEQPFVMGRPADEIEGDGSGTMVLIQGIIDAFFIEDGEIVLLDYKTDFVKSGEELKKRYQKQMDLYEEALRDNLGMRVKEKLIYSFSLEKIVKA